MRRVGQRDRDCLAACIASILELPLDDLPPIEAEDPFRIERWRGWLADRGWDMLILNVPPAEFAEGGYWAPGGYWIGTFEQGDGYHAVVMRATNPVWNPQGSRSDVLGRLVAGVALAPLEPASCIVEPAAVAA